MSAYATCIVADTAAFQPAHAQANQFENRRSKNHIMGGRVAAQDHYWFSWQDIPMHMICEPLQKGKLNELRCKQEKKCIICGAAATMHSMAYEYKNQDQTLKTLCTEVKKNGVTEYKNTQEDMGQKETDFMESIWRMYTTNYNAEFRKTMSKWGAVRMTKTELFHAYADESIKTMNVHITALGNWQDMQNMKFQAGRDLGNPYYKWYANQKKDFLTEYGLSNEEKVGDVIEATLATCYFVKIAEHHLRAMRAGEEMAVDMNMLENFLKDRDWETFREILEKDLQENEGYYYDHFEEIKKKEHDEELKELEAASASAAAIGSTGRLSLGGTSDATQELELFRGVGETDDMGPAATGTRPKDMQRQPAQEERKEGESETEEAEEDEPEKDDKQKDDTKKVQSSSSSEDEEEDSEEEAKEKDKEVDGQKKNDKTSDDTGKNDGQKDMMLKELRKKMENLEQEMDTFREKYETLKKEKQQAMNEKDKHLRKVKKLEADLEKTKEKLQNTSGQEEDAYRKLKNMQETYESLKRAHEELRKDAMKDNEELTELRKKITQYDMQSMKDNMEELKKKEEENNTLKREYQKYEGEQTEAAKKYKQGVQSHLNQTLMNTMQFMVNNNIQITATPPEKVVYVSGQAGQAQGSATSTSTPKTVPPPGKNICILDKTNYSYPTAALSLTSKDKEMTWGQYYKLSGNEEMERAGDALIKQFMFKWENTWYDTWVKEEDIEYDKEPEWQEYKKKTALKARYPTVDYTKDSKTIWNCNASQKIREYITGKKQEPVGDMYKWWVPWGQIYEWWQLHAEKDYKQERLTEEHMLFIMAKACDKSGKGICFFQFMEATWGGKTDLLYVRASGPSWNGGRQPLFRLNHDGQFLWKLQ